MKTVIIVQARMTSTRLPEKILKQVLGRPLLEYQLERLKRVLEADELVVATTVNDTDKPVVKLCEELEVAVSRGSEEDVLARYYEAARAFEAEAVVRITGDCPLIDPAVIDRVIRTYKDNQPACDYVSNTMERTFPMGLDAEVFSAAALEEAFREATKVPDREHVTPFIYHRQDRFCCINVAHHSDHSEHRWTVDTPEDFALIKRMLESLYPQKPGFMLEDCLQLLAAHSDWSDLNRHVVQKAYGQ
jgi:spore coat polysaccharide biosynthesis protein SpsF